jgi:UDP-glucose 4-epimerase
VVAIFLGRLARDEVPHIVGDGTQQRDYVFVGDVARVVLAALERPAGVFNVGTGVATSVLDLFEECRNAAGADVEAILDPPRLGELQRSVLDTGLAQRELGFRAETSFADGISMTWKSIRAEGEADQGAN